MGKSLIGKNVLKYLNESSVNTHFEYLTLDFLSSKRIKINYNAV